MRYLQKDIGIYTVTEPLSNNFSIGSTITDLTNGKFIPMSEEQLSFAVEHPKATVYDIFNMTITIEPELSLSVLKIMKIREIENYDRSANVNCFYINGVQMWLDRGTRTSLMTTIAAYKAYSMTEITLWTEGTNPIPITLSLSDLESLLIALEMYAKACFDTTAAHKANVQQLTTNQEIEDYDFLEGYPEKLNININ